MRLRHLVSSVSRKETCDAEFFLSTELSFLLLRHLCFLSLLVSIQMLIVYKYFSLFFFSSPFSRVLDLTYEIIFLSLCVAGVRAAYHSRVKYISLDYVRC